MTTSAIAQANNTIVNLLGTVNSVANVIVKTVDAGTTGIDMLDRYVQRAKLRQIDTHKVEDLHWRRNLIIDAAKVQERIETELKTEYAGQQDRQKTYDEIIAELEALFT